MSDKKKYFSYLRYSYNSRVGGELIKELDATTLESALKEALLKTEKMDTEFHECRILESTANFTKEAFTAGEKHRKMKREKEEETARKRKAQHERNVEVNERKRLKELKEKYE